MKRFVIATDSAPASLKNEITGAIRARDWSFWHWFDELWIVVVPDPTASAKTIHDLIEALPSYDNHSIVIFSTGAGRESYWGVSKAESWDWMQRHLGEAK